MRTPKHLSNPSYTRAGLGRAAGPSPPILIDRTVICQHHISLRGWPSRGGLIVLSHVTALDFEFLGLDPINPPLRRDHNQDSEDKFCQQLLLLGAKWFDSHERWSFVAGVAENHQPDILTLDAGEAEMPTKMEKRWVSVGWVSGPDGGLWVAEFDTVGYGISEKHNLLPSDAGRVLLARTMDHKCAILKNMGAKFFARLEEYEGAACLKAWAEKTQGEFGPLIQTAYAEE